MAEPEIDWGAVPYFHKDRHPSCCCTQCVSDEAEWEIHNLREYQTKLEAELDEIKSEENIQNLILQTENQRLREAAMRVVETGGFKQIYINRLAALLEEE